MNCLPKAIANTVKRCGSRALRAVLAALPALAIAAGPAWAKPPVGIQGRDDRTAVEADAYPWSSIGRLNNAGRAFCTAVLIAPDRVLTAAHCVRSVSPGLAFAPPSAIHFLAGYRRGQYVAHSPGSAIAIAPAQPGREGREADFAIVTLAQPMGAPMRPLPLEDFGKASWLDDRKAGIDYAQAGYSGDRAHILTRNADCTIAGFLSGDTVFAHGCDATHGDSGSPILVRRGRGYAVVGLHVASSRNGGYGLAITGQALRTGLTMLEASLPQPYKR